jgi:prepilin-type N-terminal cleavage/methylation domain-containing protein
VNAVLAQDADRANTATVTGRRRLSWTRIARRLVADDGFTLIELMTVMAILLVILAPLSNAFFTAFNNQADRLRRFDSQENARQVLDRMRKDIHCAHAVTGSTANASGGITVVLTETNSSGVVDCPGIVQQNASAVQWCTIPVAGATNRFRLYRENDPSALCDGTVSTFMVDYLTQADLWSIPTCPTGNYPTLAVSLPINPDPVNHPLSTYTLGDRIALRNADTCS